LCVAFGLHRATAPQDDFGGVYAGRREDQHDGAVLGNQARGRAFVQSCPAQAVERTATFRPNDLCVVTEPVAVNLGEHIGEAIFRDRSGSGID
jgi:hypothetical protein